MRQFSPYVDSRAWLISTGVAGLLATTACDRDLSLPGEDLPVVTGFRPLAGYAGDAIEITGRSLTGEGGATPKVRFGDREAQVSEATAEMLTVVVPHLTSGARITAQTEKGPGSSETAFVYLGDGRLRSNASVGGSTFSPAIVIWEMVQHRTDPDWLLARYYAVSRGAWLNRATGESRSVSRPVLEDLAQWRENTYLLLRNASLVPTEPEGELDDVISLEVQGYPTLIDVAPTQDWACVAAEDPDGISRVSLPSGELLDYLEVSPLNVPGMSNDDVAILAIEEPKSGCFLAQPFEFSTGIGTRLFYAYTKGTGQMARNLWTLEEYSLADQVVRGPDQTSVVMLGFEDEASVVFRLDLITGTMTSAEVGMLNAGLIAPAADPARFLALGIWPASIIEIDFETLMPVRTITPATSSYLINVFATADSEELVVSANPPARLLFIDNDTGALTGEWLPEGRYDSVRSGPRGGYVAEVVDSPTMEVNMAGIGPDHSHFVTMTQPRDGDFVGDVPGIGPIFAGIHEPDGYELALWSLWTGEGRRVILSAEPDAVALWTCEPYGEDCPTSAVSSAFVIHREAGLLTNLRFHVNDDGTFYLSGSQELALARPAALDASAYLPLLAVASDTDPVTLSVFTFVDDATAAEGIGSLTLDYLSESVTTVAFLGREARLLAHAGDQVLLIDTPSEENVGFTVETLALPWRADTAAVSPTGREAYFGAADQETVWVYALDTGAERAITAPGGVRSLAADGTGEVLIGIRADNGFLFTIE